MVAETRNPPLKDLKIWDLLRRDLWLRASLAIFAVLTVLYVVLATGSREWLTFVGAPVVFLSLAVVASLRAVASTRRGPEKRFWRLLAGAFGLWLQAVIFASPLGPSSLARDLFSDLSFAGFYTLLIVAVEIRPHRRAPTARLEHRLMAPAVGIFVGGWLAYFSIVTAAYGPRGEQAELPSLLLFNLLDLYLASRLLLLAWRKSAGWREIYLLLGLGAVGFLFGDLFSFAKGWLAPSWQWSDPANVLFSVPLLLVIAAARVGSDGPRSAGWARGNPIIRPMPTVLWALSFPTVHAFVEGVSWLPADGASAREFVVMVMVALLGAYALVQRHLLVRHSLEHWRERRRAQDELKESEQDLLLMIARSHRQSTLERHERTFQKAFQANPDGLSLTSWRDGRILDANRSFCELVGRSRDELIGKTTAELELWRHGRSRRAMLERVDKDGSLQLSNIEVAGVGDKRQRFDLTFEKVETSDGVLVLTVLRRLADGAAQAWMGAFEAADVGVVVEAGTGGVLGVSWRSQRAERLIAAGHPVPVTGSEQSYEGPDGRVALILGRVR